MTEEAQATKHTTTDHPPRPALPENRRTGATPDIPTRQQCMQAIGRLPSLIVLKAITPAQANSVRAAYESLLKQHAQAETAGTDLATDEQVVSLLKASPELINLMEPFLTDQQVQKIVDGGK